MRILNRVLLALVLIFSFGCSLQKSWRSTLYPGDWSPGHKDSLGRFLHDFSYAGYRLGEEEIPKDIKGILVDVTRSPFHADSLGIHDATEAIQGALDFVGEKGGGVVYLPPGTYRIKPPSGNTSALWIKYAKVVLRGAGRKKTFLLSDETTMREKSVITVYPLNGGDWHEPVSKPVALSQDLLEPTIRIPVEDIRNLRVGDWIIVRADATRAFAGDHNMGYSDEPCEESYIPCPWNAKLNGITFYRRIVAIDPEENVLFIDIPTRYSLKKRDNARVYKVASSIEEAGVEDLSIGNRQSFRPGWGDTDYREAEENKGKGAYQVHFSSLIKIQHAVNCWVQRVTTYAPPGNSADVHMLSNGILIYKSRSITIQDCALSSPQYKGEGGNGYAFIIRGSDNLLIDCEAQNTRHGYSLLSMWTHGNVIFRSSSYNARYPVDFHMHLSVANLLDNITLNQDYIEAKYRPYGTTLHGQTTTQSVIWNTNGVQYKDGKDYIIDSRQFGTGYVIGTRGPSSSVKTTPVTINGYDTSPEDFVEGIGLGKTLVPHSLFLDQLKRRTAHPTE
ncbi:MAG: glycosyl hydrolase family 28-related protein [Thermodesulfovibrionales bacterium]|nr:glycosyl hydrolase family 28-related protein [Thermodesulfovibrionales bacterium]